MGDTIRFIIAYGPWGIVVILGFGITGISALFYRALSKQIRVRDRVIEAKDAVIASKDAVLLGITETKEVQFREILKETTSALQSSTSLNQELLAAIDDKKEECDYCKKNLPVLIKQLERTEVVLRRFDGGNF